MGPTGSGDGGLYVGDVGLVEVDFDVVGRVGTQLRQLLRQPPQHLRAQVLPHAPHFTTPKVLLSNAESQKRSEFENGGGGCGPAFSGTQIRKQAARTIGGASGARNRDNRFGAGGWLGRWGNGGNGEKAETSIDPRKSFCSPRRGGITWVARV